MAKSKVVKTKAKAVKKVEESEVDDSSEGGGATFFNNLPNGNDLELDDTAFNSDDDSTVFKDGEDFFVWCADKGRQGSFFVKYAIKKNNQYMAPKSHPYSLEKLIKEHGEGHYTVYAKNASTGRVFKQHSLEVGPQPEDGFNDTGISVSEENVSGKTPSMMEMLTLFKTFSGDTEAKIREARELAREQSRENAQSDKSMVTALITMMQSNSQAQQQAQNQSTQMYLTLMKDMQENTNRMFEKFNDKFESSKSDKFGPLDIIKLVQSAEDRGIKMQENLYKMAKDQAEAIADARGDAEPKDESLMQTMVKGFIPLIAEATKNAAANPIAPAQNPVLIERQREWERQQHQNRINEESTRREQAIANQKVRAAKLAANGSTTTGNANGNGKVHAVPEPAKPVDPIAQELREEYKNHVGKIAFGVIGSDMDKKINPQVSARKTVELFEKDGIKLVEALKVFPVSDIMNIANQYGLDAEQKTWLTEYHKSLVILGNRESGKQGLKTTSQSPSSLVPVSTVSEANGANNVGGENKTPVEPVKPAEGNVGASV